MRSDGVTAALIVDGVFAHRLAVAPSEIVPALRDGMRVIGAGSIGAIRAAECWPAGMEGVGAVYSLFRLGSSVMTTRWRSPTDPERSFAAVSVALINARFVVILALRRGVLTRSQGRRVLTAAKRTHFSERRWREHLRLGRGGPDPRASSKSAIAPTSSVATPRGRCSSSSREGPRFTASAGRRAQAGRAPAARYVGHDRNLGYPIATLTR